MYTGAYLFVNTTSCVSACTPERTIAEATSTVRKREPDMFERRGADWRKRSWELRGVDVHAMDLYPLRPQFEEDAFSKRDIVHSSHINVYNDWKESGLRGLKQA